MSALTEPPLFFRPPVYILHSGERDDHELAATIAQQIGAFAEAECVTVQKLQQHFPGKIIPGISFAILSPEIANRPDRIAALTGLLARVHKQTFWPHYCVSRVTSRDALKQQRELSGLFEDILVWDATDYLPAIVEELRDYAIRTLQMAPENRDPRLFLKEGLEPVVPLLCMFLYLALIRAYQLSLPAALVLAYLWWKGASPLWSIALVVLCAFAGGFRLNFLNPTDLWPWLGARWKLPFSKMRAALSSPPLSFGGPLFASGVVLAVSFAQASAWAAAAASLLAGIVGQGFVERRCRAAFARRSALSEAAAQSLERLDSNSAAKSCCQPAQVQNAGNTVVFTTYWAILTTALAVAVRTYPGAWSAGRSTALAAIAIFGASSIGMLGPLILGRFVRRMVFLGGGVYGLTSGYAEKGHGVMQAKRGSPNFQSILKFEKSDMEAFPPEERGQVLRWLELLRVCFSRYPVRSWKAAPDQVFISYVWRDDADSGVSSQIYAACSEAGLDKFLDKSDGEKFGLYRKRLASGVAKCTHFFLMVSPGISDGPVVLRELEMAMQRWIHEMLPAIICILDPNVALRMRTDPTVPVAVRFVLTFCPQMTPAEAAESALVRYVVEFTRHEGKSHDWLALLSPSTTMARLRRLPGIVRTP